MPIPELSEEGFLPDGVHECTLEEIRERFGSFQDSDRRLRLSAQLDSYVAEVRSAGIGKYLIVNGSYATAEATPNDIDLLLILKDDLALDVEVPPFQYNPRSKRYVRKHFGFDFFFGFDNDGSAANILSYFRDVKYQPGKTKGVLKVML